MKNPKKQFKNNGYFLAKNLFTIEKIKRLEKEFDKIIKQLNNSRENINAHWNSVLTKNIDHVNAKVVHSHNVQSYSSIMLDMIQNKKLLDLAELFIGPDIVLHHTKLFLKPPIIGSAFPLHQDWSYFPTKNNSMIAVVIHLSDSTEKMGCIRLIPGSNKLGKINKSDGHSYINDIHGKYSLNKSTPIIAKKSDVLFFHCCTFHGSMPNKSQSPRKTILIQLYSGNDKILSESKHTNIQLVLRGWNYNATRESVGSIKT